MLNLLSLRGYLCCRGHFVHHITLTSSLFNVELIGVTQLCYRLISSPFLLDRLVGQKVSMFKHKCVHHLICHTNPIRCPSQSHTRPSSGWQLCVKQCVPIRFMALEIFPPGPKRWTEKKSHELEHFHCNCARWGLENDRTAVMRDLTIKSRLKSITRWLWNVLDITEEFRPHQFWNVSVPFTWSLTVFRLPRRRPGVKSPCCDFVIWARFFNPWGPDASNAEPSLTSISHYFPSLSHTHTHTACWVTADKYFPFTQRWSKITIWAGWGQPFNLALSRATEHTHTHTRRESSSFIVTLKPQQPFHLFIIIGSFRLSLGLLCITVLRFSPSFTSPSLFLYSFYPHTPFLIYPFFCIPLSHSQLLTYFIFEMSLTVGQEVEFRAACGLAVLTW